MPYTQNWGISRNAFQSPLNNNEVDTDPNADESIIDQNNDAADMEYKTQSEHSMSDEEYAKYFKEGSIHNPVLDEVVIRSGVDYDENPDYEENLKKNLSASEYKKTLSDDFKNNPYKKDLLHKGKYGRSDYSSASNIIPVPTATEVLDGTQEGLDYAGMILPPADIINAGISGLRGSASALTGSGDASKHFTRMGKSAFYTIPGWGDSAAIGGKVLKHMPDAINTLGKSKFAQVFGGSGSQGKLHKQIWNWGKETKGAKMLTGEHGLGNFSRGLYNTMFRKGYNTKATDFLKSNLGSVLGVNTGEFISKNYLSGKTGVKYGLGGDDGDSKEG